MMKLRGHISARESELSLACSMGEIQRIRGIQRETQYTLKSQHRRHVTRTGNDQTISAASEHMPRMSPDIHLSRQTAPTAIGRQRNRWYVYTSLELRSEE
jgi:hypothetical protein